MAKNNTKTSRNKKTSKEPAARPWWRRFLRYIIPRFVVLLIIAGILWWQHEAIEEWVANAIVSMMTCIGWGLIILFLVFCTLAILLWRGKISSLWFYGNRWLAALIFLIMIWGILGFFPASRPVAQTTLGGTVGKSISGAADFTGGLRILGLLLLGLFILSPRRFCSTVKISVAWFWRKLTTRRPRPAYVKTLKREASVPEVIADTGKAGAVAPQVDLAIRPSAETPVPKQKEKPSVKLKGEEAVPSVLQPNTSQQELRQVAQDVWKKYGESSDLQMVDGWKLPDVEILDNAPETEFSEADNDRKAKLIEESLASYGVNAKVVQINTGPTVTQFGVEPGWVKKVKKIRERDQDGNIITHDEVVSETRVKVDRITSLTNDLSLALAAPTIRIEAPIPGKSMVGIEVPNSVSSMVTLRSVVESPVYLKMKNKTKLAVALGKGAGGEAVVGDLAKMPHLLIAGATGSGKTVCLNTIVCGFLLSNTPYDVRFIMIDPKRVELTMFGSIPHLMAPVIVDANKALGALRWLEQEMDRRYEQMAKDRVRNIDSYNKKREGKDRMSYIVLIVDELADLMMTSGEEVEHILCRLAQLARAVGIHLIVATQRPSVDVITGLIKANFPTRISFAVTSQVDSRTIIDMTGAEKLLGHGDMLYMPTDAAKPKRLQGCYVSDPETERLVYFWGSQKKPGDIKMVRVEDLAPPPEEEGEEEFTDPLMDAARDLALEGKRISISYLQRQLRIGYNRAARIKEQLDREEEEGIDPPPPKTPDAW